MINMKILLHICCGVCAAGVARQLTEEGHDVTGFFYNPNIYPEEEYKRRFDVARDVAGRIGFKLEEGANDYTEWQGVVRGLEGESEGGKRCAVCFRMRLEETYKHFLVGAFDAFTTTLTISPMKNADLINTIGQDIAGEKFLQANFKKKEGFKKTMALAREWNLYRQSYCGCEYSINSV